MFACLYACISVWVCMLVVVADGCIVLIYDRCCCLSVFLCIVFVCVPHLKTHSLLKNLVNKDSVSVHVALEMVSGSVLPSHFFVCVVKNALIALVHLLSVCL